MNNRHSLVNRILSLLICVVMVLGMLPTNVVAAGTPSTLTTTIGDKDFVVGQSQEFTFTSTANDDYGTMVMATFEFSDDSAIEKLEYYETAEGMEGWRELPGREFGPPTTGFPMINATSRFRVTFKKAGTYTVKVSAEKMEDRTQVLCSTTVTVTVRETAAGEITTNIGAQKFYAGLPQEFTFGSIANGDVGTWILGHFEFSDPGAIGKLEYYETNAAYGEGWHEMAGNDFGPPATGFPMTDATSRFRVTFNKPGTYTVTVSAIRFEDRSVVAETTQTVVVAPLATVQGYTGGSVTGNASNNVTLDIENVTLNWDPADTSIGRNEDAWWVGMKVVAPAGMTEEQLQNTVYQSKGSSTGAWSANKSFWSNKDSAAGDAEHYIGMWFPITPETVAKFISEQRDITMWYQFDWDNDGIFEQTITFCVDPNGVTLNKKEQTDFAFADKNPEAVWVLNSYKNEIVGAMTENTVVYEIIEGSEYAHFDTDGVTLIFDGVGTVKIRATCPGNDFYKDAVAVYQISSFEKIQHPAFSIPNPMDQTYTENMIFSNALVEGYVGEVTYTIENMSVSEMAQIDPDTGALTIHKAGTVQVLATVEADGYVIATKDYTLTVNKAEQTPVFTVPGPANVTFNDNGNVFVNELNGYFGDVTYSIEEMSADGVAEIDAATGELTIYKAGTVKVTATVTGDDCYHGTSLSYELTIEKAEQHPEFTTPNPSVTYNDNENLFANGLNGYFGDVTYAIESMSVPGMVEIDAVTGELTIHKAGTVRVAASVTGDDCYHETVVYYALTVEKDTPTIFFREDSVEMFYGTLVYINDTLDLNGLSDQDLTYTIEGANGIGAAIDADGKLTFADSEERVGQITVKVTRAEDDCYHACSAEYTLTLVYQAAPEMPCEVSGEQLNESGWYTGEVTITAPAGYQISYTNALSTEDWAESVAFNTEGTNAETTVYLKDADGFITDAIAIRDIYIDTVNPEDLAITYTKPLIEVILETVTFGLYQSEQLEVTISATDSTSGIAELTYNIGNGDESVLFDGVASASHSFTINAQYRDQIVLTATDTAGRKTELKDDVVLVLDTTAPNLTVGYTYLAGTHREENGILFTQNDTNITFIMDEANFDLFGGDIVDDPDMGTKVPAPVVKVNNIEQTVTWTQDAESGRWEAMLSLSGNGDYTVTVEYADPAGNAMETYQQEIRIDNTEPVISVSYDNTDAKNEHYYAADRTATVTITEHNFNAEQVILSVTAKDITGKDIDIEAKAYADYAKDPANWSQEGDVWTLNTEGMKFDIDAIYSVTLDYTDLAGNATDTYTETFVMDHVASGNIQITYSEPVLDKILEALTFGFYQADVTVTVTAEDMTAGVEYFEISYIQVDGANTSNRESFTTEPLAAVQDPDEKNVFTATYTIPAQARGTVSVLVMDWAGNESAAQNDTVIVVDDVAPGREVIFEPYKVLDRETMLEVESYREGDDAILYYRDQAVVTFRITEANFDLTLLDEETEPCITVNGEAVDVEWEQEGDVWTATYIIEGDGDYVVKMSYKDLSSNEMVNYESCNIVIDGTAPVVEVVYQDGQPTQTLEGIHYYQNTQTVAVQITDHNFRADDVVLTVTAKDVQGNPIDLSQKAYADYAKERDNWISDGDVHTLKLDGMVFDVDAIYTLDIAYDDICDNPAEDYAEDQFVVDHDAPANLTITYSTPILEKVIEALTFGFYQAEVVMTITAEDVTAGVDFFTWTYTKQEGTSDVNAESFTAKVESEDITYSEDGKIATATIRIPANARGHVAVSAADRSGNTSQKEDNTIIHVVDQIAPEISVEYTADDEDTKVQFIDGSMATVDSAGEAVNVFYNGNVTANIVISEANFFEGVMADDGVIHQVGIKLTKTDDAGNVTVTEYLPIGAEQKYEDAEPVYICWVTDGDKHSFAIPYDENADYVLEVAYTDLSANDAQINANDGQVVTQSYTSKMVTVDKIAPVIQVEYSNTEVVNTLDGRKYLDKVQSATITVTEHNFRAADVKAVVTAVDFLNADVAVADFAAQLADEKNWTHDGDVHTAKIQYTVDANYSFDIDFLDLAQNASADYTADLFTVDTTAPTNLTVSYSTNVFQEILESITFGYYNATMTVTITADDATTGIHHFAYSYINGDGVSGVNAELLDQAIEAAVITHNGITGTATFNIPKMVLGNDNQFNGTVTFTAFDRSENSTDLEDTTRIVVDNISPNATITYNSPVQNSNGISYYDGNIEATIAIDEANFDAKDVMVTVTKDGAAYPVNVYWRDNSVDSHIGSFVLTEDGDYFVSVQYKDKSGNQMADYKSNELTLDTVDPVIKVSNIKANSANKDATYGFVIEFSDTNLDTEAIRSVLKAVVEKAEGVYEIVEIDLGELETVVAGQTYTYTIEDLPDDALYTLTCEVKDMANRATSKILLEDEKSYEQVQFSINRKGSAFGYGTEFTEKLVEQYYVYNVDGDIVVVEVNVDPVEEYKVTLNGKELTEGTDYKTEQTSNAGEWSKRTYTISKDLFNAEGEYSIIVSSTDKAETTAFSDVKNLALAFVVDRTKPVLTITGLESGGRYQTEEQTVTLIPTDEGGRLNNLSVIVLDSDGNPLKDKDTGKDISVRFEMSGEELLKYLEENDGKITFTIPDGLNNKVKIICNDCAVNAENLTNEYEELFENVTVSQNWFIIFYANKPAFYGTIAGILALAVVSILLINSRKNKKAKA